MESIRFHVKYSTVSIPPAPSAAFQAVASETSEPYWQTLCQEAPFPGHEALSAVSASAKDLDSDSVCLTQSCPLDTTRTKNRSAKDFLIAVALALLLLVDLIPSVASAQSTISTVAGGGGLSPGPATASLVGQPTAVAVDQFGNVFFASDTLAVVYKVDSARQLTIVAGTGVQGFSGDGGLATSAELWRPTGVAVDSSGNVFIGDTTNGRVRRVDAATGIITTVAGGGSASPGDGGPATGASLLGPSGISIDRLGNLLFTEGNRVRHVDMSTGVITTVAGNGGGGLSGDGGLATSATLNLPLGVATDSAGNMYIADSHNFRIRKVDSAGTITTFAGGGTSFPGDGGPATSAGIGLTFGVAVDSGGNLFITESGERVHKVDSHGIITTVAGNGTSGFAGDGGPATSASLQFPWGIAVDTLGNLFVSDYFNSVIRRVDATSLGIATYAGQHTLGDSGPAVAAVLAFPFGISTDQAGNILIADSQNNRIRKVNSSSGIITTVAGNGVQGFSGGAGPGDGGPATSAILGYPYGVAADSRGNIFIAEYIGFRVRRVDSVTGNITTVAGGKIGCSPNGDGGPAINASFGNLSSVAVDQAGNLFIGEISCYDVRRVDAVSGVITTVAGNGTYGFSGDGGPATSASLSNVYGIALDAAGNLFIADAFNGRIRRVDAKTGIITTVAGGGSSFPGDGGPATSAILDGAFGVAIDGRGNLFISGPSRVRRVDAATGIISTVAGNGVRGFGGDGGPATNASLNTALGLALDSVGNLFVVDQANSRVRSVIGVGQQSGSIEVTPSLVAFGSVPILTSSSSTITITNTGQGTLTVNSISISGANFALGNLPTLPLILAPSGSASFEVIFSPLGIASSNASITITSSGANLPTVIQATGNGITLPPATSITVRTDQAVYHRGQSVQITGSLAAVGGAGISNIPVSLQVAVNGTGRNLTAYTDPSGTYHTVFQPAPNDGGALTVTAVATSGGATQKATANFRILGLLLTPGSISQDLVMGSSITLPFGLQNLGDAPLNSLSHSVTVTPAGAVSVTPPQSQSSIASGTSLTVPVTLTAPSGNPPPGTVSVVLNVSGIDPASGLTETNSAMIVVTLRSAVSVPVLVPSTASVGVNPGSTVTSTFTIRNDGFATINSPTVALQNAASLNWVALAGSNLGSIVPGDSRQFTVEISPPSSVPVGSYAVPFTVSVGSTPLQGILNISVTQSTMGSVSFVVNDDIGANVAGATVTLYGKTNGKTFQGVTDSAGLLTINGVDAGDYSFVVVADTHDPANGVVTVTAGATAQVRAILSYNVVALSFLVTPTTIVDQYNVTLNVTYATTLPKPALQVVPYSLDFSFFPENATNGRYACSLSITNTHPTAPVRNLALDATQLDVSQPVGQRLRVFFSNDLQTYQVGDLAGKATVNVPCYAVIDGSTVPSHTVGNIAVQANFDFSLSGQVLQGTTTTNVPVTYTRPSDLTFNSIAFTYDEKTDPANPVLIYNGNGYVYDITSNRVPAFALQKPAGAPFNGHNLVAFTETQGGTTILGVINGNQSSAFWHGDFDSLKQSLSGLGASTTYDISTLDCPTSPNCTQGGLTLPQALASQVAINPNQVLNDPTYLAFEGQWADGTSLSPYIIPVRITTITPTSITTPRGPSSISGSCNPTDPLYALCKDNFGGGGGGFLPAQGGQIIIAIDQTLRLERQAFNASLGIGAKTTLTNVVASIQILDANGANASSNFFILVTSDPLGATHGGTVAGQTIVSWQLIPNAGAGGTLPQGAQYQVRASLSYTAGGVARVVSTQTVTITVLPSPKLTVAYSAPFVVVPGKDAKIRVTVQNIGYGTARNLTIQSAQPRVAATLPANPLLDNPGPLVNFTISGSSNTADGSSFQPGNLTISFGDVAPGATVSGYWSLQVSQRGYFIDISSTLTHSDFNGVALDPLILPPTTTLVPAVGGTVTTDLGQAIPGLTVDLSQAGSVIGSDQTDSSGVYYIQDLGAGIYLEEVRDLSGTVLTSKDIVVLGNQATDFIDFVISNYNPTQALVCVNSSQPGVSFSADGVSYSAPHCFVWTIGSSHTLGASTAGSGLLASMIRPLAASALLAATTPPGQTFVGWSDAETAATRTVTVTTFGAAYAPLYRPTSEVNQYVRTQVTTDLVDHKWPSMNTQGDLVWSQKDTAGFWQVWTKGLTSGIVVKQITFDQHNHERPVISDNGTIAWFQDNTGGGLGYAIERLDPGTGTPSIVEFSSRNVFCPTALSPTFILFGVPIFSTTVNTGPCSYKEHAAGKTFGIGSDGRTISFYTFTDTNNPPPFRRFNVTGIGRLPMDSSPADFYGYESPDLNIQSDIVYANSFVPGVVSTTRYIWLATTTQPFVQTLIDQGQNPHLSDRPAAGTNPEIVYIQNGIDVTHWPGADPSRWTALGLWADIEGTGPKATIVYECVVNGLSQICTAKPAPLVNLAVTSGDQQAGAISSLLANALAVKVTDQQGNPLAGVTISFSISQQPPGAVGALLASMAVQTGPDGIASTQLTMGNTSGQYQVTASCAAQNCSPSQVVFAETALGTSTLNVITNLSAATFVLTGPATYSGGGISFVQTNTRAGTYTITYGNVSGYLTPSNQTLILLPGRSITFTGNYVIAPTIITPADGSQPRSMYLATTGTAMPNSRVAIWLDGNVAAAVDVDTDGNWEQMLFGGAGNHQLRVQYENDLSSLSNPINVSINVQFPPPALASGGNVFLKLRKADVILTLSLTSPQIRLYGPHRSHAALFLGADPDGTPIIAEAVTATEAGNLGQVRAVPLELSTVYTDGRAVDIYRPVAPLSLGSRNSIVGWARGKTNTGLSYWSIPFDLLAPFSEAALFWNFQRHRPRNQLAFQRALNNLNSKKYKTGSFICSTLVWRAYFEGTGHALDLSEPNTIIIQPASILGNWIGDPSFIDQLRPYFVFPDTLGGSPELVRVQ